MTMAYNDEPGVAIVGSPSQGCALAGTTASIRSMSWAVLAGLRSSEKLRAAVPVASWLASPAKPVSRIAGRSGRNVCADG